jgi:hypothetical protein|tara:strand:+ start:435 stop:548 length:114 start_codon:yes stop_codon:yes gene_type:complete
MRKSSKQRSGQSENHITRVNRVNKPFTETDPEKHLAI